MKFTTNLTEGRLIKRYKRFLADIELTDGRFVTVHVPNTGSMKGCCESGSRVWLSRSGNPKRKYPLTWEMVETGSGVLVGINTGLSNFLVKEGIERETISELQGYSKIRTEVRYGNENSRIDLLLENDQQQRCYVEVKNVTLAECGVAYFPDAVTTRGSKHLRELTEMVRAGHRAVIFFCIQREDVDSLQSADDIDPVYGETLRSALSVGVEAYAYAATLNTGEIVLSRSVPVVCGVTGEIAVQ